MRSRGRASASVNSIEVQTGHSFGVISNLGSPAGQLKRGEFILLTPYWILCFFTSAAKPSMLKTGI
jgi:hypothetical protein